MIAQTLRVRAINQCEGVWGLPQIKLSKKKNNPTTKTTKEEELNCGGISEWIGDPQVGWVLGGPITDSVHNKIYFR